MSRRHRKQWAGCLAMAAAAFLSFSMEGAAAENTADGSHMAADGADSVFPETTGGDILSVELPVVEEGKPSPFDFILDPCRLLYETGAMRYGGGTVEEGATLLFGNKDGEYTFSRYSDRLEILNKGEAPVNVTVSASVSNLEGIALAGHKDFSEDEGPSFYLALVDGQGNEVPIPGDGEARLCIELSSGVCSFGLTGACSPAAGWQEVYACPKVTVTWHVERAEEKKEPEDEGEEGESPADEKEEAEEAGGLPDHGLVRQEPAVEEFRRPLMTEGEADEAAEVVGSLQ